MNRRLFLLAAMALGGCATMAEPPKVTPATRAYGELEPLYSAAAGREALIIQVGSNGCTAKADFAFYVERRGEAVTLAFGRKRVDPCKSFAQGKTALSFTWEELGLAPRASVVLLNPLTAWTGPGAL
jgi:hypothetical protein